MNAPLVLVFATFLLGLLVLASIAPRLDTRLALLLAYPVGLGSSVAVALFLFVSGLERELYHAYTLLALVISLPAIRSGFLRRLASVGPSTVFSVVVLALVPVAFSLLGIGRYAVYTSDSFSNYAGLGRIIAIEKTLLRDADFLTKLTVEPLVPFTHALGYSIGLEHIDTLYPIASYLLLISLLYFIQQGLDIRSSAILTLASAALLMLNNFYVTQSLYVLPNITASLFLSLGYLLYFSRSFSHPAANRAGDLSFFWTFSLILAFSALARTEFKILNLMVIFLVSQNRRDLNRLLVIYIPIAYLWDFSRFIAFGMLPTAIKQGDFLLQVAYLDAASLAGIMLIYFCSGPLWRRFALQEIAWVAYAATALLLVSLWLVKRGDLLQVLANLLQYCADFSVWGATWYIAGALFLVAFAVDTDTRRKHAALLILTGFFLFRIMAYLLLPHVLSDRSPLGSGNRTLLHIIPFVVYYGSRVVNQRLQRH